MKVRYYEPKGRRLNGGTYKFPGERKRTRNFMGAVCENGTLWYSCDQRKWLSWEEVRSDREYSTLCAEVHSVKALRRRVRQWAKDVPPGTGFRLMSRFRGGDVRCQTGVRK